MTLDCLHSHTSSARRGEHFVYRFFDSSDCLLYVGVTKDLARRVREHRQRKPWWPEVARIEGMQFDCGCHALDEEQAEIRERGPLYEQAINSSPAYRAQLIKTRERNVALARQFLDGRYYSPDEIAQYRRWLARAS